MPPPSGGQWLGISLTGLKPRITRPCALGGSRGGSFLPGGSRHSLACDPGSDFHLLCVPDPPLPLSSRDICDGTEGHGVVHDNLVSKPHRPNKALFQIRSHVQLPEGPLLHQVPSSCPVQMALGSQAMFRPLPPTDSSWGPGAALSIGCSSEENRRLPEMNPGEGNLGRALVMRSEWVPRVGFMERPTLE